MSSTKTKAGWALDHGLGVVVRDSTLTIKGEARAYLVNDFSKRAWSRHRYVRFDLTDPLSFDLDVSRVPCGCLATVYLVAMEDPTTGQPNYCDMAHSLVPGFMGGICTELDIMEVNNNAAQTAVHTETGGDWGSGRCDQNGCASQLGGPNSPHSTKAQAKLYGPGKHIDSNLPFSVKAFVDNKGELKVTLTQGQKEAVVFDRHLGGNPQGSGVPEDALRATAASMGKLALVASLWKDDDNSWFDGPNCKQCNLDTASFKISNLRSKTTPRPPPPTPPPEMPSPEPPVPEPSPPPSPPFAPMPHSPPSCPPPTHDPRYEAAAPPALPPGSPRPITAAPANGDWGNGVADNVVFKLSDDVPTPPPSPAATLVSPMQLNANGSQAAALSASSEVSRTSPSEPREGKAGSALSALIAIVSIAVAVAGVAVILWVRLSGQHETRGKAVPVVLRMTKFSKLESREGMASDDEDEDGEDDEGGVLEEDSKPQRHQTISSPTPLTFQVRKPPEPQGQKARTAPEPVRGISIAFDDEAADQRSEGRSPKPAVRRAVSPPRPYRARSHGHGLRTDDLMD